MPYRPGVGGCGAKGLVGTDSLLSAGRSCTEFIDDGMATTRSSSVWVSVVRQWAKRCCFPRRAAVAVPGRWSVSGFCDTQGHSRCDRRTREMFATIVVRGECDRRFGKADTRPKNRTEPEGQESKGLRGHGLQGYVTLHRSPPIPAVPAAGLLRRLRYDPQIGLWCFPALREALLGIFVRKRRHDDDVVARLPIHRCGHVVVSGQLKRIDNP